MTPQEILKQHDVTATTDATGNLVVAPEEATKLAEYLELMYDQLHRRGLCPNGSPLFTEEISEGNIPLA
jgi:hypothetical protein